MGIVRSRPKRSRKEAIHAPCPRPSQSAIIRRRHCPATTLFIHQRGTAPAAQPRRSLPLRRCAVCARGSPRPLCCRQASCRVRNVIRRQEMEAAALRSRSGAGALRRQITPATPAATVQETRNEGVSTNRSRCERKHVRAVARQRRSALLYQAFALSCSSKTTRV